MAVSDAYVFPGFLTPVLTQLFFPKPPTTFLTCFCRGERRKYAGKKSRLKWGSNSRPPGYEFDTLTTEPPGQGFKIKTKNTSDIPEKKEDFCAPAKKLILQVFLKGMFKDGEDLKTLLLVRHMEESDDRDETLL